MSNGIHGIGHGGASADSSYYSNPVGDGTAGSSAADQPPPQEGPPIDIFELVATWLEESGILSAKTPPSGAFQLFGCQSPFSSGPARPAPQPPKPLDPYANIPEEVESKFIIIQGIEVPHGSKDITRDFHAWGGLVAIDISENFVYQGIPVSKGKAVFDKSNQQLLKCILSENFDLSFTIGEQEYSISAANGTLLHLHQNDSTPEQLTLDGEWKFNRDLFSDGSVLTFLKTGQLTEGRAQPGSIIQGYDFIDSFKFHKNKQLANFTLAEDGTIQGIAFKKGTWLFLDEQGLVRQAIITEQHTIHGKTYDVVGYARILFDQAGHVVEWKKAGEEGPAAVYGQGLPTLADDYGSDN